MPDSDYIQNPVSLKSSAMNTPSSETETVDLEHGGSIQKRLTLTFRDVSVHVTAPDAALGETMLSYMDPRQVLGYLRQGSKPKRVHSFTSSAVIEP